MAVTLRRANRWPNVQANAGERISLWNELNSLAGCLPAYYDHPETPLNKSATHEKSNAAARWGRNPVVRKNVLKSVLKIELG